MFFTGFVAPAGFNIRRGDGVISGRDVGGFQIISPRKNEHFS